MIVGVDGAVGITTGAVTAVGVAVGVGALTVLHRLPTGLSPIRNAVSQYGITPYRLGYRVQTLAYAVAGTGAAIGIGLATPGRVRLTVILTAVFAGSRALISWFPMDEPGTTPTTTTGRRHGLLAIAAFLTAAIAAGRLGAQLHDAHTCHAIATISEVLGYLMGATLVGMVAVGRSGWFGLVERIYYAEITCWLLLVAMLLFR